MNLTDHEKKMLDGGFGSGPQTAVRLLVTLGEVYEAKRMIPVSSCHVGGRTYLISGEESIEWMTASTREGPAFRPTPPRTPAPQIWNGGKRRACPKTWSAISGGRTTVT
jgi:hypothetical protein